MGVQVGCEPAARYDVTEERTLALSGRSWLHAARSSITASSVIFESTSMKASAFRPFQGDVLPHARVDEATVRAARPSRRVKRWTPIYPFSPTSTGRVT
jgi:hypothetical protein